MHSTRNTKATAPEKESSLARRRGPKSGGWQVADSNLEIATSMADALADILRSEQGRHAV